VVSIGRTKKRGAVEMTKKAYKLFKEGDFYVLPAGYTKSGYRPEIKTMDLESAKRIQVARKTLSLKKKYPEVRQGVNGLREKTKAQTILDKRSPPIPSIKSLPDIYPEHEFTMRLKVINNYQVTFANAEHYLYDGYKVTTFKVEGKYALYVSDEKIRRK
jgi:hypothetical protein